MNAMPTVKTVKELLDLRQNNMLTANPEYQRAAVWDRPQQQRLVDSLMRGYPIPLIYLHHIKREVSGMIREDLEIIDGQQRLNALHDFHEGAFKLFPADDEKARFPAFVKQQPCPWGGKRFQDMDPALQQAFLKTPLSVVMVEAASTNEARDLFIRLQAGMPLNSQEKRDAWPGNFTEFVLRTGGKPQVPKYPGEEFFQKKVRAKSIDRGDARQLAAQMYMLFAAQRLDGPDRLCEIKREDIDNFYYRNLDFDINGAEAKRFVAILDETSRLLGDGKRKPLQAHEAIHLLLLVDSLTDDYTKSWKDHLAAAFDDFRYQVALAKKASRTEGPPGEYWTHYGQWTGVASDRADTIKRRHKFFVAKMHAALKPALKDSNRIFGALERELIYFRDRRHCQAPKCGAEVAWADAEIHHVIEHAKGGATSMENGALVHKSCHPKSESQVLAFADFWQTRQAMPAAVSADK